MNSKEIYKRLKDSHEAYTAIKDHLEARGLVVALDDNMLYHLGILNHPDTTDYNCGEYDETERVWDGCPANVYNDKVKYSDVLNVGSAYEQSQLLQKYYEAAMYKPGDECQ